MSYSSSPRMPHSFVTGIVVMISVFLANGCIGLSAATQIQPVRGTYNVRDYGATGNGVKLDTKAIQAAIDVCADAGGGRVYLSNGTFISGTIYLRSNVTLYIEAGAVLLGSRNLWDYPVTIPQYRSYTDNYTDKSLIYAERVENISIMGRGVIDGQGEEREFRFPKSPKYYKHRPFMMRIIECKDVTVRDVTFKNSAMWVQHYLACENVNINGISIESKVNTNNDGIDVDSCNKVRISNCQISTGDDAIVLKSTSERVCENVVVTNCVLNSNCNGFKTGTESNGGFKNITVDNCTIYDSNGGILLNLVDGGEFDCVNVSNIVMRNVLVAIFVRLGNRARPYMGIIPDSQYPCASRWKLKPGAVTPEMGSMRNIMISNVQAMGVGEIGCAITGLPGHAVENVTMDNVRIRFKGGGTVEHARREIPEYAEKYPSRSMFGILPAYGFYVRHAKNVKFSHLDLGFEKRDDRPALVFDDIKGLEIFGLDAASTPLAKALIWLKHVDGVFIHGCQPEARYSVFVCLDGEESSNITLMNNDFSRIRQILEKGEDVKDDAVYLGSNRTR